MSTETAANKPATTRRRYEVNAADLPAHCPTADTALWNMHPRVYLPVAEQGEALCPYCGAHFVFKGKAAH